MNLKRIFTILSILMIISFSLSALVRGNPDGGGGVSVMNVSPKIKEANLEKENGVFNLTFTVSDYNGWDDIYRVNGSILSGGVNGDKELLSSFGYKQYNQSGRNGQSAVDKFLNYEGHALKESRSEVDKPNESDSISGKTEMLLSFYFYIDGGEVVELDIEDRSGLHSELIVKFPSFMRGIYSITPLALVGAVVLTAAVGYKKFGGIETMEVE